MKTGDEAHSACMELLLSVDLDKFEPKSWIFDPTTLKWLRSARDQYNFEYTPRESLYMNLPFALSVPAKDQMLLFEELGKESWNNPVQPDPA